MAKTSGLKTKEERIIHNERVKLTASCFMNIGFVVGLVMMGGAGMTVAMPIYATGRFWLTWSEWWVPAFFSIFGLLIWGGFFLLASARLDDMVDPDDLPKPTREKRTAKKSYGRRSS